MKDIPVINISNENIVHNMKTCSICKIKKLISDFNKKGSEIANIIKSDIDTNIFLNWIDIIYNANT